MGEIRYVLRKGNPMLRGKDVYCTVHAIDDNKETLGIYKGYYNPKNEMWSLYPEKNEAGIKMQAMKLHRSRVKDWRDKP